MDVVKYAFSYLLPVVLVWVVIGLAYYFATKRLRVKTQPPQPWYLSGFTWWIVLTAVYVFFNSLVVNKGVDGPILRTITGVMGLFVPVGAFTLIGIGFGKLVILPFVLHTMYMMYKIGRDYIAHPAAKIVFYLTVLLCLTVVVDLFVWGCWQSLYLFGESLGCVDLSP